MIVQEQDEGLLLFRQTDHALLSGAFAAQWGSDAVPSLEERAREAILVAAARHDDGWSEWELAPTLLPNGRPVDFIRVPVAEHVALYRRGIDLVQREDDLAGLVVSLHGERLYTRPFFEGMDPRIQHLADDDRILAEAYVAHERERQSRLVTSVADELALGEAGVAAMAEEAWRLLQVWDRLSLLVCMQPLEGAERTMPAVAGADGDVRIEASGAAPDVLRLAPYPFREDPATFTVEAVRTSRKIWEEGSGYRREFRLAEPVVVTFSCRSA